MSIEHILIMCGIGILAGWLASLVMKGGGSGLIRDLIIGLLGGIIGGWLIPKTGLTLGPGYVGAILTAFIGAVVLLLLVRIIAK
ncbi:MAG TPA: GlsB/YeaQ/YmgE family stress response membrane protein [Verrucomicrobiales bacterium]|jgi:uncharacterized membrane protein YeaQ/YmgE (transglycosylase-associated protein family)|nr:GlsB/YeaQ/YmgE family stress response membrane protein [Verrucomicrobiales bacterium]